MTHGHGSEMACHPDLTRRLKIDIRLGRSARAPWQRGSNENTNGLLRQFFPKSTDPAASAGLGQTALNDVARLMTDRPCRTLGWKTLAEAVAEEIAAIRSAVVLET